MPDRREAEARACAPLRRRAGVTFVGPQPRLRCLTTASSSVAVRARAQVLWRRGTPMGVAAGESRPPPTPLPKNGNSHPDQRTAPACPGLPQPQLGPNPTLPGCPRAEKIHSAPVPW